MELDLLILEVELKESVEEALSNPLLDIDYKGATGALIQITGGNDMVLDEVSKAGDLITETLDQDANVIWGARVEDSFNKRIQILTIITGVSSPQILGKEQKLDAQTSSKETSDEFGIKSMY